MLLLIHQFKYSISQLRTRYLQIHQRKMQLFLSIVHNLLVSYSPPLAQHRNISYRFVKALEKMKSEFVFHHISLLRQPSASSTRALKHESCVPSSLNVSHLNDTPLRGVDTDALGSSAPSIITVTGRPWKKVSRVRQHAFASESKPRALTSPCWDDLDKFYGSTGYEITD